MGHVVVEALLAVVLCVVEKSAAALTASPAWSETLVEMECQCSWLPAPTAPKYEPPPGAPPGITAASPLGTSTAQPLKSPVSKLPFSANAAGDMTAATSTTADFRIS